MNKKFLVGLQEIADWLNGERGDTRKWIGIKSIKALIKDGGLPAKRVRKVNGPWTITEDALIDWHRNYKEDE